MLRDVVLQSTTEEQFVVVGRHPGVLGELVSVQSPHHSGEPLIAQVLATRPIIVDGSLRHELRLQQLTGAGSLAGISDNERPFDE